MSKFLIILSITMSDINNIPGVRKLNNSKRGYKASITASLNKLQNTDIKVIPHQFYSHQINKIEQSLSKIDTINNEIYQLCAEQSIEINLEADSKYEADIHMNLAALAHAVEQNKLESKVDINNESSLNNSIVEAISTVQNSSMVPKMHCIKFNGLSSDKFAFKNFMASFENCVGNLRSDSAKLSYLRSVVTDYAFSLISHLTISDANYTIAVNLLRVEFMDNEFITDEIFREIINFNIKFDNDFSTTKKFLAKTRANLFELNNTFNLDFLSSRSAGNKLMSHIIFSKLPLPIKRELIRIENNNYPSLDTIFSQYQNVIRALLKTNRVKVSVAQEANNKVPSINKVKKSLNTKVENRPTLENFTIKSNKIQERVFKCKFCSTVGQHSMLNCNKYETYDTRKNRCIELNMCHLCSSMKHSAENCVNKLSFPCKYCSSTAHISALCPEFKMVKSVNANVCLNTGISENLYLLPIIQLTVKFSNKSHSFNVLLDSGSQRTYFSEKVLNHLKINKDRLTDVPYEVRTYLSSEIKSLKEIVVNVGIGNGEMLPLPVLIDNKFNLKFEIADFQKALYNFKNMNIPLAASFDQSNAVEVDGLIGIDYIQFLNPIKQVKLMHGSAFEIDNKICPFGNIIHFLYPNQVTPVSYKNKEKINVTNNESNNNVSNVQIKPKSSLSYNTVVSRYSGGNKNKINFCLNPKSSYEDPISEIFNECDVERKIDNFLNLYDLENNSESTYDADQIKLFEESIQFKNGSYYVKLPWLQNIESVPSNYNIALSVLDRVIQNLERKNLINEYTKVFKEQEQSQIIERFEVNPEDYSRYIWIPHRAVIREGPLITTKIRPVFNCSLKSKGSYSLNECAYPGINLLRDLTELLLYFRTNNFAMIGDIRKAFLQIKLASDEDRNRFCFFWRENGKIVTYRYNTIIFGFNSSPFILNYIIKFHLRNFPNDLCNKVLNSQFYCDNLLMTSNDTEELYYIYTESISRMQRGGFELVSWNSNNPKLREIMKQDDTLSEHGLTKEKVLGYTYCLDSDVFKIANNNVSLNCNTKRSILSQISSVFDPLGLCLPVTVRGKFIMKSLWSQKLSWDTQIKNNITNDWSKLALDLNKLNSLTFPRYVFNTQAPVELYFFCDASGEAYGFCCYAVQNGCSNLLFAKAKISPVKKKSLPTLELLGVYTAFKCLQLILNSFTDVKINNIFMLVDAQVVLSWCLNDINKVNCKNKFIINRLKEISVLKNEINTKYFLDIKFKYVPSNENPADILSRGLSFNKFCKNMDFWTKGPEWLRSDPVIFPTADLACLSDHNKTLVSNNILIDEVNSNIEPIISFDRFSRFDKLVNAVSIVFKFVKYKSKSSVESPVELAKQYLLRIMQMQSFAKEYHFLSTNQTTKPPELVKQLDLFIDQQGLIRSRGRINKSQYYDYNITNPILLAKDHSLTNLIISSIHERARHMGLGTTLTKLRLAGFWVPRSRQAIKNVLSKCFTCKKYNSLAYKYPKLCNLPKNRVNFLRPFQEVGIDYTAHIFVKTESGDNTKVYLLLFTCLQTRAVHVEIVGDMTTTSFVQALIRFTNHYSIPSTIFSDNARSFIAAFEGNIISYHLKTDEYLNKFAIYNISHKHIPLYSPWYGACWERLVGVVKRCLYKSIGRAKVTYFELLTLISDIQSAVNSRPLTYRCSDDSTLDMLTPNSFLKPNINTEIILNPREDDSNCVDPPSRLDLVKTLENRERLIDRFKTLWHEEYLLSLRELNNDLHQVNFSNRIKENQVVLIKNPAKPRPYWYLGRVLDLIIGDDGNIRCVKLLRGDGKEVLHSLKHLYPLELSITHDVHPSLPVSNDVTNKELNLNDSSSFHNQKDNSLDFNTLNNSNKNPVSNNSTENLQDSCDEDIFNLSSNASNNTRPSSNLSNSARHSGSRRTTRKNAGFKQDALYYYYK